MKYISVCSGIEAATVAWNPLGREPLWFSEIEKFPSAVLTHRFPNVPNLGDMTKFMEWPDEPVDMLVGGTPCQSFSVAGLRKGLDDPRGNLMLTYLAIAGRYRPKWIVWENVPGVLSSNEGRDFGTFLTGLGKLGYGFAFRVLDSQYVRVDGLERAVPQRRRRVFVVGYIGDWRRAAAVLFDAESLRGDTPPRREARQDVAPTISARPTGGGGLGTDFDCDGGLIASTGSVAHCLNAGGMGRIDYETETMVAHAAIAIQERAVSTNPDSGPQGAGYRADDTAYTLEARNKVQAVTMTTEQTPKWMDDCALTLTKQSPTGGGQVQCVATVGVHTTHSLTAEGHDASEDGSGRATPVVAFAENQQGADRTSEVVPALSIGGGKPGQGYPAVAFDLRGREGGAQVESVGETDSLRAADGGSSRSYVAQPWAVRRLTPTECERLQGFPDNWTDVPYGRGNRTPDGPRYKALGNSMAVNCMRWIGRRIEWVESEFPC